MRDLASRLHQAADRVRRWTSDRPLWLVLINAAGESVGEALIPPQHRAAAPCARMLLNQWIIITPSAGGSDKVAIHGYRVEDRSSQDRVMTTVHFDLPVILSATWLCSTGVFLGSLEALGET